MTVKKCNLLDRNCGSSYRNCGSRELAGSFLHEPQLRLKPPQLRLEEFFPDLCHQNGHCGFVHRWVELKFGYIVPNSLIYNLDGWICKIISELSDMTHARSRFFHS